MQFFVDSRRCLLQGVLLGLVGGYHLAFSHSVIGADTDSHEFSRQVKLNLSHNNGLADNARADLGLLPAGKSGLVKIVVSNPLDCPIPVNTITTSCGCTQARLSPERIPPRGTAALEVVVSVPAKRSSERFTGVLHLGIDSSRADPKVPRQITVVVNYKIIGMVAFRERMHTVAVRENEAVDLQIPFVATTDTPKNRFALEATGIFAGLEGKLIRSADGGQVVVKVPYELVEADGSFGKITLMDRDSELSDSVSVIAFREKAFRISPRTLRFREAEDGYQARAILHLGNFGTDALPAGSRNEKISSGLESAPVVVCQASLEGVKLKPSLTPLARNIYRIAIRIDDDLAREAMLADGGAAEISWTVFADKRKDEIRSKIVVYDRLALRED